MSSKLLKMFYREYAEWLNNDAPDHPSFSRDCGLCSSLEYWRKYNRLDYWINSGNLEIVFEMRHQFIIAGLDPLYPLNRDCSEYYNECYVNECHLNEKRRQWVFDHAK